MKKINLKLNIDWKSKIIDLLIVIIGISIAFKLNTWNESKKLDEEVRDYISSFYNETKTNEENLREALDYSVIIRKNIDTLKQILISKNYDYERIIVLSTNMMGTQNFSPSTTTMENIKASGEFELIKNVELREKLIGAYNHYDSTLTLEKVLSNYTNEYITPFFFSNLRLSNLSSIYPKFIEGPQFENIVFGYQVLLSQQIEGYQETHKKIILLNENLTIALNN